MSTKAERDRQRELIEETVIVDKRRYLAMVAELDECKAVIREFTEWQGTVQELLPDGLYDRAAKLI